MVPTVESSGVCVWRESGIRRSVLCRCVWQESGFSRREDVFTFDLLYKKIINCVLLIRFAINCVTVQHKKKMFNLVKFDGSYYANN
jgi:hypothetical protein